MKEELKPGTLVVIRGREGIHKVISGNDQDLYLVDVEGFRMYIKRLDLRAISLKTLAEDALNVQDACNLSGVAHGFSRAMTELRAVLEAEGSFTGTACLNTHSIAFMWASKIASLTGCEDGLAFSSAYDKCKMYAAGGL